MPPGEPKDVTARVAQLVALAGSPYEQEARTSAYLACKLIRENGLRVVSGEVPADRSPFRDEPYRPGREEHQEEAPPFVAGGACRATARYDVVCLDCRRFIRAGETLWWRRGTGGVHFGCNANVLYPGWRR